MHEDRISPSAFNEGESSTDREDAKWQSAVFNLLLTEDPHQLSRIELTRALVSEQSSFEERDAVERAVDELLKAGLVQESATLLSITRAGRFFVRLHQS